MQGAGCGVYAGEVMGEGSAGPTASERRNDAASATSTFDASENPAET